MARRGATPGGRRKASGKTRAPRKRRKRSKRQRSAVAQRQLRAKGRQAKAFGLARETLWSVIALFMDDFGRNKRDMKKTWSSEALRLATWWGKTSQFLHQFQSLSSGGEARNKTKRERFQRRLVPRKYKNNRGCSSSRSPTTCLREPGLRMEKAPRSLTAKKHDRMPAERWEKKEL